MRDTFQLTPQEKLMARLIREGLHLQECAREMLITVARAKAIRSALFREMDVENAEQLAAELLLPLDSPLRQRMNY